MSIHSTKFLRKPEVLNRFGMSNSQLYKLIQLGAFPAPIKLSARSSAWIESELDAHAEKLIDTSRGVTDSPTIAK